MLYFIRVNKSLNETSERFRSPVFISIFRNESESSQHTCNRCKV